MKLSIATYATTDIIENVKTLINEHHNHEHEASWPVTNSVPTHAIVLTNTSFAFDYVELCRAVIDTPESHSYGFSLFQEETIYGETKGFTIKSSNKDTLFIGLEYHENNLPVLVLAYIGSRESFAQLATNAGLKYIDLPNLVNIPEDLILYKTHIATAKFWESKGNFAIRVGGEIYKETLISAVEEISLISDNGQTSIEHTFLESKTSSWNYKYCNLITKSSNQILCDFINVDDLLLRNKRAVYIKSIIDTIRLSRQMLYNI